MAKAWPNWALMACEELGVDPCKVAYLQGFRALPLDNARTEAVLAGLEAAENVEVVASPEGGYTQATGLAAAQDVLQANPDVTSSSARRRRSSAPSRPSTTLGLTARSR